MHDAVAFRLRQIAVNRLDVLKDLLQTPTDRVDMALRPAEDDRLTRILRFKKADKSVKFTVLVDRHIKLLDRLRSNVFLAEIELLRFVHILFSQTNNRRRQRRAKKKRLTRLRRIAQN